MVVNVQVFQHSHFLLYLFSMISDSHSKYNHTDFQKYKANTPATAHSVVITPLSAHLSGLENERAIVGLNHHSTLFRFLEERFQDIVQPVQEPKIQKDQTKNVVEEELEECDFKIGVAIIKENGENLKTFTKTIIKSIDISDETTLIFDRQHEKSKIQENIKYIIEVNIETSDGFSKVIWKEDFKVPQNCKKWSVLTINSEKNVQSSICLNVELQKIGKFFLKPLSVKFPVKLIDEFFDYKFKLLNKSELLSHLESVTQLKGILLPLSKQNMGSRIIQKLLTKAKFSEIEAVIHQLKPHFKEMIFDRYGNYVFQKIFKVANDNQRKACLKKLQPDMIDLLKSKQGTHSMQTLVDNLQHEEIYQWFSVFTDEQVIDLSTNKFSMHFIQKLVPIAEMYYLFPILIKEFKALSSDKQGIVVLKSLMSSGCNIGQIRYAILNACQNCVHEISFTQFGHYIVEQMFMYYNYYELQNILSYMTTYISYFAQNQFSSSIVRKAIDTFGDYVSVPFIKNVVENGLDQVMECSTGEFVLHRLMESTADENHKMLLMNKMMILSKDVKNYEKRQKWMKFFKLI